MAKAQSKKGAASKTKKKKVAPVSYHKKPEQLEIKKWQIELRRQFVATQSYYITNEGDHPVFSDFLVSNPTYESTYKVAIRSKDIGQNFCSCPDFKTNQLGTCKHIEWTLRHLSTKRGLKKHFKTPPERAYSSIYLDYTSDERSIRLRIGNDNKAELESLAKTYFDDQGRMYPHAYLDFERFWEKARAIQAHLRCYEDALGFILQQREDQSRSRRVAEIEIHQEAYFNDLLKVELFPYQKTGVLFAAKAGRCLIADEMGLGKTVQAIGAAELLRQEHRIASALIVCPTSLKYQWKTEIEKFTGTSAVVIEGPQPKRRALYENDTSFFKIITYNVVVQDARLLNNLLSPDLIILDEAQRIKNWNTKISRAVKSLNIRYRFVLTGTPLENKIEELYSIVQFVDPYALGPLYFFLDRHQVKDETGRVIGYQDLGAVNKALQPVMLRRLKKDVLKQLPERMDKNLFVPMTREQSDMHQAYADEVAKLVAKWRRFHFLNEQDRNRLLSFLNLMKMSCSSTFIVDQKTRHDTKIDEVLCILEEALVDPEVKVVIFSQWERMTRLVAQELLEREIPFESLHGGVSSEERGNMLIRFNNNPECRIFLSTDAGGVGLNLQSASLLINLDIPWNPAVLEQRIARIYRMGQERRVNVINLISIRTLEHRLLDTLKFKASMAAGVLDNGEENIFLGEDRFKEFMNSVENLTQTVVEEAAVEEISPIEDTEELIGAGKETEQDPTAALEDIPTNDLPPVETRSAASSEQSSPPRAQTPGTPSTQRPEGSSGKDSTPRTPPVSEVAPPSSAQELVSMGVSFLSGLSQTLASPEKTAELVNSLVQKDEASGQTYLKIPVQNQEMVSNALQVLGALFGGISK
jgi:SNF2 family DNA or RNA helicase